MTVAYAHPPCPTCGQPVLRGPTELMSNYRKRTCCAGEGGRVYRLGVRCGWTKPVAYVPPPRQLRVRKSRARRPAAVAATAPATVSDPRSVWVGLCFAEGNIIEEPAPGRVFQPACWMPQASSAA